jgi:hypothetical protein
MGTEAKLEKKDYSPSEYTIVVLIVDAAYLIHIYKHKTYWHKQRKSCRIKWSIKIVSKLYSKMLW